MNKEDFTLNRNQIKYILIVAMFIDHIAWGFVKPGQQGYFWMHFIGRLTGPTMAFFLAEGYRYTSNVKQYLKRLGIFALLSWPAFVYFEYGTFPIALREGVFTPGSRMIFHVYLSSLQKTLLFYPRFGVIYTLFLALLALRLDDQVSLPPMMKEAGLIGLGLLSVFGDWPVYDVLFALVFHRYREEPKKMWFLYCILALCSFSFSGFTKKGLYQFGMFLVPLLLLLYRGERGSRHPFHKWVFYAFYPLHLLLLGLLRWGL